MFQYMEKGRLCCLHMQPFLSTSMPFINFETDHNLLSNVILYIQTVVNILIVNGFKKSHALLPQIDFIALSLILQWTDVTI